MAEALTAPHTGGNVVVDGISRRFLVGGQEVPALHDVSLRVAAGEFVAIVGPSGCGKSTFLRLLAGLDLPDSGTIALDGEEIRAPGLSRGIVFQDHRLLPWLTVQANIALSLRTSDLGADAKAARVADLIRLVGLAGFEQALPHQLSGGMAQRAAIARALAPRPPVLLLDEPLGALDTLTRSRLQQELLRIWEHERTTVVLITHDVEEALLLANRVVVMGTRPGRIVDIHVVRMARPRLREDADFQNVRGRISAQLLDIKITN